MRKSLTPAALFACVVLAGCGAPEPRVSGQNSNSNANAGQTSLQHGPTAPSNIGVASSHGGGDSNAAGGAAQAGSAAKPPVETPELDAKVQKAEAKAKASGASEADKKAAAAADVERADLYRDQGNPTLYRFARRDYRIGLRYDPTAREPRAKMDEIVSIYKSMGRPVPELGSEPQKQ